MEKAMRITKAMRFADVAALLQGAKAPNGSTVEDALKFIEAETALLAKKNAAKSSKQTEAQKENETFKILIQDYLSSQSEGRTCTEIAAAIPELNGFNNQKISALMRSMTYNEEKNPDGVVEKAIVKGKSLFTLR